VRLRILALNLDTGTPTGKLMLNLLGSIAEFEHELMLERQREGIAKAKAEGKYKGRAPTARRKADDVIRLKAEGKTGDAIAAEFGDWQSERVSDIAVQPTERSGLITVCRPRDTASRLRRFEEGPRCCKAQRTWQLLRAVKPVPSHRRPQ
jgi:hypothetical protein